ncbi:arsenite efflux pump ArsB [Cupriavidus sp. WKF15]|uniref:arsenite efflux pump ArsB n=1 Tax=Cupriavidus sp. WKF15 TaxID=3032282 RepID=UPI0023E1BFD3|nr:arsenite efflux pump ArsB [Cupriavidus sp. WKF15]WER47939.1 arsenite efflux pump ArsB [Cupriavidus sp. WKF15]
MLLYVATVPLPQPTMEADVVEHHGRAVRVSAPRLRWQGALSQRAGSPVQIDAQG